MIVLKLGRLEYFNPENNTFEHEEGGIVRFEYSLRAVYEWEGKWLKPFLVEGAKLTEIEMLDFYYRMALDPLDPKFLTNDITTQLSDYIAQSGTATVFSTSGPSGGGKSKTKTYTSEEIYALMADANIDIEFENRNLNRLFVLLRIISANNQPEQKMSREDILTQNRRLNEERKVKMRTKG